MIPVIEIGKRYLYKNIPVELQCLGCGVIGVHPEDNYQAEIIVDREAGYATHCAACGSPLPFPANGWYHIYEVDNPFERGCVPYTQLHEIEGEVYDKTEGMS